MAISGIKTPIKVRILKREGTKWKNVKNSWIRVTNGKLNWTRFTNCIQRLKFDGKQKYKFWITYTDDPENCNGGVYTDKKEMLIAWNACIDTQLVVLLWNDLERKKFPLLADYSILDETVVLGANTI